MTRNYSAGRDCHISEESTVGYEYNDDTQSTSIGDEVVIRAGTIIYGDVIIGDNVQTGHNAVIREATTVGDETIVGTQTVIDGYSEIGNRVSLQTGVYIPSETTIGDRVFIGPNATLTNDPYPVRQSVDLDGPTIADSVSIGANATVLPSISIGERSFVAAGSVVTKDVPPETMAVGAPAEIKPLPEKLSGSNDL